MRGGNEGAPAGALALQRLIWLPHGSLRYALPVALGPHEDWPPSRGSVIRHHGADAPEAPRAVDAVMVGHLPSVPGRGGLRARLQEAWRKRQTVCRYKDLTDPDGYGRVDFDPLGARMVAA